MSEQKRQITEYLFDVSPYELEGTLVNLQAQIQQWIDKHGPTARLDWDAYFQHVYDPNPSPRFNLVRDREENDKEYTKRLAREKIEMAAQDARELAELERLQKKFAGNK
jgi:hypothetical protein